MNNGKICVSVCAETADELLNQIKRAENSADVIEIRFDCLDRNEFENIDIPYDANRIYTFRPREQGGKRELSIQERKNFWKRGNVVCGADFEEDVVENNLGWIYEPVICSHHDFEGVPENLFQIYERIKSNGANVDVIKLAVQAQDITDSISIWKLLEKAHKEKQKIIPIAMGESGKWTRILGLAHGAFMTYASLDSGKETAPGQVSARDLIEVYRAKKLDKNTDIYGIIGGNTSYSMSPYMHNAAFKFHNLNAVFVPLQMQNLDEFIRRMVKPETREIELNFKGFAVTIPHKQNIIKHLDFIDETAKKIGAVNTVKIVDGKLYGYNTDAEGFIQPLLNSYGDLQGAKVALVGAGGASRACVYALKQHGADITIFARDVQKAESLAQEFGVQIKELPKPKDQKPKTDFNNFEIVVNTTPLGTKGEFAHQTIAIAEQIANVKLVYDLVYNPFETKLLQEAGKVCVPKIGGLAMLIAQAVAQQKIWTGLDAPMKEMAAEVLKILK